MAGQRYPQVATSFRFVKVTKSSASGSRVEENHMKRKLNLNQPGVSEENSKPAVLENGVSQLGLSLDGRSLGGFIDDSRIADARAHIQAACTLLKGLGPDFERFAWLLDDTANMIDQWTGAETYTENGEPGENFDLIGLESFEESVLPVTFEQPLGESEQKKINGR
jgi:hypothetical protein